MTQSKKTELVSISSIVLRNKPVSPEQISLLINFDQTEKDNSFTSFLKRYAVPLSLIAGAIIAIFSTEFEILTLNMPQWTNLHPRLLAGLDYLWSIIGDPVEKENILYHLPNIFLYGFGIIGIKSLVDTIKQKTWLEKVLNAKTILLEKISTGDLNLNLGSSHSLLFVGNGDFIGMQYVMDNGENKSVTISSIKPPYTNIWNKYDVGTQYDDLQDVIEKSGGADIGEYIFFPVKDDQIFLPNKNAYDLSPHKIDIICQNIRNIEKEMNVSSKRIVIIGDRFHNSRVLSEDKDTEINNSEDIISLISISKRYKNVTLIDPSDIVIKKIIDIASGRKIVFRATKEGIVEYKERFYDRVESLGYEFNKNSKGTLTIGYDLFEDQTEQQTLIRKLNDYYPVVLSQNVRDALIRNGYKNHEFLYVPELVLEKLKIIADEQ